MGRRQPVGPEAVPRHSHDTPRPAHRLRAVSTTTVALAARNRSSVHRLLGALDVTSCFCMNGRRRVVWPPHVSVRAGPEEIESCHAAGRSQASRTPESVLVFLLGTRVQAHDCRLGQGLRRNRVVNVRRARSQRHIKVIDAERVDCDRVMVRRVALVGTRSVIMRLGCISVRKRLLCACRHAGAAGVAGFARQFGGRCQLAQNVYPKAYPNSTSNRAETAYVFDFIAICP